MYDYFLFLLKECFIDVYKCSCITSEGLIVSSFLVCTCTSVIQTEEKVHMEDIVNKRPHKEDIVNKINRKL